MYRLSESRRRFIAGVVAGEDFQRCRKERQRQQRVRRRRARNLREEREQEANDADDEGKESDFIRIIRPGRQQCECRIVPPAPLKTFFELMDGLPPTDYDADREFNRNQDTATEDEWEI